MGHWSFENVYSRGRQRAVLDTDLARVVIILGCLPSGDCMWYMVCGLYVVCG